MKRVVVAAIVAASVVVVHPSPAAAHTIDGAGPTNYRTDMTSIAPSVDDIRVRILEFGARIEATNRGSQELVVLGYQDEPYLRITADGVFENERSPATYLNQDRQGQTEVPDDADPDADPKWKRVSDEPVARWHDHRVHWMGDDPPPAVRAAPSREHVIYDDWVVPMRYGADQIEAHGTLRWIPAGSAAPWYGVMAAVLLGIVVAGLTRFWRPGLMIGTAVVIAAGVAFAVGVAGAPGTVGASWTRFLAGGLYPMIGWLGGAFGIRRLARRQPDGALLTLLAGFVTATVGGLTDLGALSRSQVAFAWSDDVARLLVAVSAGGGIGLMIASAVATQRYAGGFFGQRQRAPIAA